MNSEEWTARSDVKHRAWRAREAITRFKEIQTAVMRSLSARTNDEDVYTIQRQRLWSEQDGVLEAILDQGVQLYKAVASKGIPHRLREEVENSIDTELRLRVRVLRNIRAHWEDNRQFWTNGVTVPPGKKHWSARWYKEHFPEQTPWSSSWDARGHLIGGIVSLEALEADIDRIEAILPPSEI